MTARATQTPAFLLLFLGLALLAMLAVPLKELISPVDPHSRSAAPGAQNAEGAPNNPEKSPELSEQQAQTLSSLMQKLKENPNDADALTEIGSVFVEAKDWTRAESFLSRAALSRPADPKPRHMLALSLYRQHKMPEATAVFEEILAMQETDAVALFNLAIINKYHLKQPEKAKTYLHKLVNTPGIDPQAAAKAKKELEEQ